MGIERGEEGGADRSSGDAGDGTSAAEASWAASPDRSGSGADEPGHQARIDGARTEVARAYEAPADGSSGWDSWAAPPSEHDRVAPAEVSDTWGPTDIRDNDWEGLRELGRDGSRFSEGRIMWVDVTDPRLESTDAVRGEPFKGGEPTDGYKRDLTTMYERRGELTDVRDVDPRHTGDNKVRIEESPDGELTITNGRHRIQAAREAGIPAVLGEAIAFRGEQGPAAREPSG